jgi:TonB family protein
MTAPVHPAWLDDDFAGDSLVLVRRMLAVSLALHLAGLALVAGVRFKPKVERLEATQVTLVSLSQPAPAPVEPAPQVARPEPPPKPAPPQRASAPIAAKVPVLPSVKENLAMKAADAKLRDALQGIERPPEAPRLGEYQRAPAPKVAEPRLQEKQPSLADLARQLEPAERPQPKPAVVSKPKPAAKPLTKIQVTGDESGLGRYLAVVQNRISEQWVAPPVDAAARSYQVIIKFRLHKSGRISDVTVERESGNGYYDDAGKRAVLSVGQLPPFPVYVTEETLETHFSFTVGEEAG